MTTAKSTNLTDSSMAERCPSCGAPNGCAVARSATIEACWCWQQPHAHTRPAADAGTPLPSTTPPTADARCYCADCLPKRFIPASSSGADSQERIS